MSPNNSDRLQPCYWLLKQNLDQTNGGLDLALEYPILIEDEQSLEMELVKLLQLHPWNDEIKYTLLFYDPKGIPELEPIEGEYLAYLQDLAWDSDTEYPIDIDETATEEAEDDLDEIEFIELGQS